MRYSVNNIQLVACPWAVHRCFRMEVSKVVHLKTFHFKLFCGPRQTSMPHSKNRRKHIKNFCKFVSQFISVPNMPNICFHQKWVGRPFRLVFLCSLKWETCLDIGISGKSVALGIFKLFSSSILGPSLKIEAHLGLALSQPQGLAQTWRATWSTSCILF